MKKDRLIKNLKLVNLRFAADLRFAGQHNDLQIQMWVCLFFFPNSNLNLCDNPKYISFSPTENSELMNILGLYLLSAVNRQHGIRESFMYFLHLKCKCRKYLKFTYVGMFVSVCLPTWSGAVALWSKWQHYHGLWQAKGFILMLQNLRSRACQAWFFLAWLGLCFILFS